MGIVLVVVCLLPMANAGKIFPFVKVKLSVSEGADYFPKVTKKDGKTAVEYKAGDKKDKTYFDPEDLEFPMNVVDKVISISWLRCKASKDGKQCKGEKDDLGKCEKCKGEEFEDLNKDITEFYDYDKIQKDPDVEKNIPNAQVPEPGKYTSFTKADHEKFGGMIKKWHEALKVQVPKITEALEATKAELYPSKPTKSQIADLTETDDKTDKKI